MNVLVFHGEGSFCYFAQLKDRSFFDKFCNHFWNYLGRENGHFYQDEAKVLWDSQQVYLPEFLNELHEWDKDYFFTKDYIVLASLFSALLVGTPWLLSIRKKLKRLSANPPTFTPEQIEAWKPYHGKILRDADAIRAAAYGVDFSEEKKAVALKEKAEALEALIE